MAKSISRNPFRKRLSLVLSIGMSLLALFYLFFDDSFLKYIWLFIAIFYWIFFFKFNKPYIQITPDSIIFPNLIADESIRFTEIKEVYLGEGEYILKTANRDYRILKSEIHEDQLEEFERFFNQFPTKRKR